jgi:serine protease Do
MGVEKPQARLFSGPHAPGRLWSSPNYGRYGTRASHDISKDVSLEGFKKALEGALELHGNYPANKASLAGKTGPAPRVKVPEEYPMLRKVGYKATVNPLNPGGGNPGACIHCHQLNNNLYRAYRGVSQPIPATALWTFPMPDVLGLELDPRERATVKAIASGSPAAMDGFKAGDEILTLDGQPILLHHRHPVGAPPVHEGASQAQGGGEARRSAAVPVIVP